MERNGERREFATMGACDSRDFEITHGDAIAEISRPLWKPITLRRAFQEARLSPAAIQQDDGAKVSRAQRRIHHPVHIEMRPAPRDELFRLDDRQLLSM